MTEVIVASGTIVAYSALKTDIPISTVFAVFSAVGADICTFRAALTASTNHIYAVFTILALCTVVTVAAYAIETNPATQAKFVARAICALLMTILTAKGTVRASIAAVADPIGAFHADIAVRAIQFIADTVGTFFTLTTDPATSGTFLTAFFTNGFAHLIATAALVLALATFETEFTVVALVTFIHAITARSAVVFVVAIAVGSITAVVSVVAFPVIISPSTAVFALYAILIIGINGGCKQ